MFRSGQQIGSYILVQRIGRGGFGEVWLAERRTKFVTTKVAVKLPLDEQIDAETIKLEATLWEQASGHPNVLPIIDADDYDGQIVIVSEYAPDGSLELLLEKTNGTLPISKAVELTIGILSGLEFLHSRQIIHRDIKPANILLQGDTPRLTDFGISRAMKTTSNSKNIAGTPFYMSPEAFDGKRTVQTDIWSVGVILYQMLSGKLPFSQSSQGELLAAIIMREAEPLLSSIPPELRRIVMKAIAKQSTERYQTAREMRDDLQSFLLKVSQNDFQATQPMIESSQLFSQATEKMPIPFQQTAKQEPNQTHQPILVKESIKIETKPTKNLQSKKFLAFAVAALLLLSVVGGGYYLMRDAEKISSTTNQNPLENLEDIQPITFLKNGKYGFSDINKKLIIEAKYDDAYLLSEGLIRVMLNKNGVSLIKRETQ